MPLRIPRIMDGCICVCVCVQMTMQRRDVLVSVKSWRIAKNLVSRTDTTSALDPFENPPRIGKEGKMCQHKNTEKKKKIQFIFVYLNIGTFKNDKSNSTFNSIT